MSANSDQATYWDSQSSWIAHQNAMDALLEPVLQMVLEAAALRQGERVLDVGCGTGASLIAAAERVGNQGKVTGVDISQTLLDLAQARCTARNIEVLRADAQTEAIPGLFDVLISRFGVMFFEDTVAAFRNLSKALGQNGRVSIAAWGPAPENPYFMKAAKAVRKTLGEMPKVDRTLPGPFAMENAKKTKTLLEVAGLTGVSVRTSATYLTPIGSLTDLAELCLAIGPAASGLAYFEADAIQRNALAASLKEEFAEYETPEGLRIPAAINLIYAKT